MNEPLKVTRISLSSKGWGMLAIVRNGRSETRHCAPESGGWSGFWLDAEKLDFSVMAGVSAAYVPKLRALKIDMPVYRPQMFVRYMEGSMDDYYAAFRREHERGKHIVSEQLKALELAIANQERNKKEQPAKPALARQSVVIMPEMV